MPLRRVTGAALALVVPMPIGPLAAAASPARPRATVAVSESASMFAPAQSISVGSSPQTVAIGDVTGDGRADALLTTSVDADPANDYKLFVFAQRADGSLASPVRYDTRFTFDDTWGMGIALLDASGDGRRDVALATEAGVQLLTQTTAGTLQDRGLLPGTEGAWHIVAADMDRDGDADLVVNGEAGTLLLSQGPAATFVSSVVAPEQASDVEVGDVDGDGRTDIAVCGMRREVLVYHRTATGWNRTAHTPVFDDWSVSEGLEIADVSGDGRADVAVTVSGNSSSALLNVFLQTPTGGLAAPVAYHTPDSPQPVEAADVNGDRRTDLVIAHGGWYQVSVLLQRSDGTLAVPVSSAVPYATSYNSQGLALGDINGDKRVDAALADYNNGLVVLRNIQAVGTALSSATSATAVTYGAAVTVSGQLTRSDAGTGVAGVPVELYGRRKGSTSWVLLGTATSTSSGAVALGHKPSWSLDYQWAYQGSSTYLGSTSALRAVGVRPAVSATLSRTSFPLGRSVGLSGKVAPAHGGQIVYLQRLVDGRWSNVSSRVLSSTSTYAFAIRPLHRGTHYYRVYKPADTDHLAGFSGTRSFTVY